MEIVKPGSYDPVKCYQSIGRGVKLHPMVKKFLEISNRDAAEIYSRKHNVNFDLLLELLNGQTSFLKWAGTDIIPVTNCNGEKAMTVIEVNSCPGGNPFSAWLSEVDWQFGHSRVIQDCLPFLLDKPSNEGCLAVLHNLPKNHSDMYGYASALADLTGEEVLLANMKSSDVQIDWNQGEKCQIKVEDDWKSVRAAFCRLGLTPWAQVPIESQTTTMNPMVTHLCGGHNKIMASQAFELFNQNYGSIGFNLHSPYTITNVPKENIGAIASAWDYMLVIKVPYSAAGVGIYIITNKKEFDSFMGETHYYELFVVQALIGQQHWYQQRHGLEPHFQLYPRTYKGQYMFDLRFIISCGQDGWKPANLVGRRCEKPLQRSLSNNSEGNIMLKTNVSRVSSKDGTHRFQQSMALIPSVENFENMALTFDDLIDGYVQSVMSAVAIDNMCKLITKDNGRGINIARFSALNPDNVLLHELNF